MTPEDEAKPTISYHEFELWRRSDLSQVERLLRMVPADLELERAGLEARRDELLSQLKDGS